MPGDMLLIEENRFLPTPGSSKRPTCGSTCPLSQANPEPSGEQRSRVADGHLLDIPNLVFAGTPVLSGRGRAVVCSPRACRRNSARSPASLTGVETGLSPLQKEIVKVTHVVLLSLAMGGTFFAIGISMGLGSGSARSLESASSMANVRKDCCPR